jgi:UPF0755 protein
MFEDLKDLIKIKPRKKLTKDEIYLLIAFFAFFLGVFLFTFYTPNYFSQEEPIELNISTGMSLNEVIDSLCAKNVIPGKTPLKIAAFLYFAEDKIKAGNYKIPNGLSYFGLIELLLEGAPEPQIIVTIQEGIWQHRLAGLLQNEMDIDSAKIMELSKDKKFIKSLGLNVKDLEGYLLPNTYYFYKESSEKDILRKLVNEMNKLFDAEAKYQMRKLRLTKNKILTLASIIEAESNITEEFARISGVYHNRLRKGYKLQADPTVQYLKRHRRHNKIYYKDLEIDSPFNTYKNYGLPPRPINNPGKEAVMAALYPEEHNYLYFVADGTGHHKFAKSLNEHNKNVSDYRRWRRENN